ncbi:MAG TPA: ribonuclease E inhibitor RraB [Gemmatimonadaceae bacterium]|nr:ribonuclease E inhibitor RraB [Gemmatimonadaceae bacterium]
MSSGWLCLVSGAMVPTEEAIRAASTRLQAVAAALGSEYDGWEAAVER